MLGRTLSLSLSLSLLLVVSFGTAGCFSSGPEYKTLPPPTPLRMELEDFTVFLAIRVEETADDIYELDESPAINRNTLFWRMRVIPMSRRTLGLADDEAVLLEQWLISRRMMYYFEKGPGVDFFGKATPRALEACRVIDARIEKIAARALTPKQFAAADAHLTAFTKAHPGSHRLDPAASESWDRELVAILEKPLSVLKMPLTHVSPMGGVSDAAVAVHRVAASVEQLELQAEYLPANLRWQTDLLVLELEESKSVQAALRDLDAVSEGAASIAETAAKLPAELREEISKLVTDVDQMQVPLQATLDKAHATAQEAHATAREARATVEGMDKTLGQVETVVQATDPAAQSLTRLGETLTGTIGAFTELMEVMDAPPAEPTPPAEPGPPFDIDDYGRTADKLTETVKALGAVLVQVQDLTDQKNVSSLVGTADLAVQSTLDYFFVGTGILILFSFLVALGYRFLTRSMQPRPAA